MTRFAEHVSTEFLARLEHRHRDACPSPSLDEVNGWIETMLALLFPQRARARLTSRETIETRLSQSLATLEQFMGLPPCSPPNPAAVVQEFATNLSTLHELLELDAQAIFSGDPAAASIDEVVIAYPGFLAIAMQRIAHHLHLAQVPVLPRLITECAHSRTGIDIHPGAQLGRFFCIDHGTGIVIGETAVIGEGVKIYQGVTLGALSVEKSLSMRKRHPTIEDRVVIYSNATILGGDTVIGHDAVIGGNVWLTKSIPPRTTVYHYSERVIRAPGERDDLDKGAGI